jgi:hypothetical protein
MQPANPAPSTPPSATASAAASMPARQVQAVAAQGSWAHPAPAEHSEAGRLLGPSISVLIGQSVSSAAQNPALSAFGLSAQMPGDATGELGSILPQLGSVLPRPAGGPITVRPRSGAAAPQPSSSARPQASRGLVTDASLVSGGSTTQSEQSLGPLAAASVVIYGPAGATQTSATRKARQHKPPRGAEAAPVRLAATFPASRQARGAIGTGGGSGASPTAALFALALVCMPMLLAGRIGLDLFRCKSALLTSRLERPG